jgi:formamidopyrimidine-DNA glycosylase
MPELPEVEVTRRSFAERIAGARVRDVRMGKPLRWPLGVPAHQLVGCRVGDVSRRGKYLWLPLSHDRHDCDAAPRDGGLLLHLGMSGALRFASALAPAGAHDHFDLETDRGTLRLHDPRRFGAVVWSESPAAGMAGKLLAGLGVEPLSPAFTAEHLYQGLRGRRVSVKQAVLAGDIVVGVGNIYCCEALFDAGIDPRVRAHRVSRARSARLAEAIVRTLERALALGGSTLRDFRDAHGMDGAFQLEARVYGRAGQPCCVCGTAVRRVVQGQRATYFCPSCQKR